MHERRARWRPAPNQPTMISRGAVHRYSDPIERAMNDLRRNQLPPIALPSRLPAWRAAPHRTTSAPASSVRPLWRQPSAPLGQVCALTARVTHRPAGRQQLLQWEWEVHAAVTGPSGALLWARARCGTAADPRAAKAAATRAARAWAAAPQRLRWDLPARALTDQKRT